MLSGLFETSLCNCLSFDSINADWRPSHILNCLKYDPGDGNGIADALGIRLGDAEKDVA